MQGGGGFTHAPLKGEHGEAHKEQCKRILERLEFHTHEHSIV